MKVEPTLYLIPGQVNDGRTRGNDIEKHLKETRMIKRCLSLEDDVVKRWIADPTSYPEEFRRKSVCLWRSRQSLYGNLQCVATLGYGHPFREYIVNVGWMPLAHAFSDHYPALVR